MLAPLADRAAGHWGVIIPTTVLAGFLIPGSFMIALGGPSTASGGVGMLVIPLMLYVPWLIGYVQGVRKRNSPLRDEIREIHASNARMEELLAAAKPADEGKRLRLLPPVSS